MAITLTTPIAVPNITRIKVADVLLFDSANVAKINVEALSTPANGRRKSFQLEVANGKSQSIAKNVASTQFDDDVVYSGRIDTATGYDQVEAAYRSGANKAAAYRAVETALLALGVIDATLTGTVG